ncbi:MAG: hypothetical protein A3F68_06290 [Acidobacteria bacterium RIFCSPLOWO2_12_FULL_54_10]|nr:MAG: hypothetical protein A3F68_06290 [Acidobacteria bacterium RIFCSPLOWO2_12_FULL_54_10]
MKTTLVLTVAVLANSVSSVCLSKGMKDFPDGQLFSASGLLVMGKHVITDPWMIAGVMLLITFLAAYLTALSWADLSFVLPATAPGYIVTLLLSKFYLGESISPARWAGTVLIVLGTFLVARTYQPSSSTLATGKTGHEGFHETLAKPTTDALGDSR